MKGGRSNFHSATMQTIQHAVPERRVGGHTLLHVSQQSRDPIGDGIIAQFERMDEGLLQSSFLGCIDEQLLDRIVDDIVSKRDRR